MPILFPRNVPDYVTQPSMPPKDVLVSTRPRKMQEDAVVQSPKHRLQGHFRKLAKEESPFPPFQFIPVMVTLHFNYLIRQPLIFGFPSNESRVIALPSVCALSSSPALPHKESGPDDLLLAPNLPPESDDGSPNSPVSPLVPASHSSEEKHSSDNWFLPVVLTFIVTLNTCNAAIVICLPFDWHLKLYYYKFITAIADVYRQI
ncbi:hypothetical protein SADUNF_Sadunf08G0126200 [Salix dunnii]|uniref:Uncharacterized protein n=1 Tax=Salix dunnii TaxID=1413687 RepID=A0A835MY18_9ROSI|nr:hypothetical protein SADUNF_Sadunf08G0126200 [Salix dunnii]